MSAKFDFTGGKELVKMLNQMATPQKSIQFIRNGTNKSAQIVKREAKSKVPVDQGSLRRSIIVKRRKTKNGFVSVSIGSTSPIAHLIEFGVKRHLMNQTRGRTTTKKKVGIGGDVVFNTFMHSGHPGMPFLRPALESNVLQIVDKIKDETKKSLFRWVDKNKQRGV